MTEKCSSLVTDLKTKQTKRTPKHPISFGHKGGQSLSNTHTEMEKNGIMRDIKSLPP